MKLIYQGMEGVAIIEPLIFEDNRGTFRRTFCAEELNKLGINFRVCQGNISENLAKHTMRGFHYQKSPSFESKILTPVSGSIYNVIIDLRSNSQTFLKSVAMILTSSKRNSLLVPAGCANAFLTLEKNTIIHYYMGDYFKPESYSGFKYNDPFFNIDWPHNVAAISEKDENYPDFTLDNL